jgi:hypothetical protein
LIQLLLSVLVLIAFLVFVPIFSVTAIVGPSSCPSDGCPVHLDMVSVVSKLGNVGGVSFNGLTSVYGNPDAVMSCP